MGVYYEKSGPPLFTPRDFSLTKCFRDLMGNIGIFLMVFHPIIPIHMTKPFLGEMSMKNYA